MVHEVYLQDVSTRSVDDLFKTMGKTGISKSPASGLCTEIDERVGAFLERPIEGGCPTYASMPATSRYAVRDASCRRQ